MNSLLLNKDYIPFLKEDMQNPGLLYKLTTLTGAQITPNCISIVMTASNRSAQTYFTLKTIADSSFKNVQVILVDDSTFDPCVFEELQKFPLYIDFIEINRDEKRWINPVINYNIGFKYIKGDKIIIQNAEVCHIGDCIADLVGRMRPDDNSYYVYDIITVKDSEGNKVLHKTPLDYTIIAKLPIYGQWYQSQENCRNLHFLVGLTAATFKKLNSEFSYDYTFAFGWDDDDMQLKVIAANINIVNLHYEQVNIIGIHQYHEPSPKIWGNQIEAGLSIFTKKKEYYEANNIYIDLTADIADFDNKLLLLN